MQKEIEKIYHKSKHKIKSIIDRYGSIETLQQLDNIYKIQRNKRNDRNKKAHNAYITFGNQKKYIKEFEDLYPNYTKKDVCIVVEDNNSSLSCKRKRNATIIESKPVPQDVQNNSLSNRHHRSYINNYINKDSAF